MNPLLDVLLPGEHCILLGPGRSHLPEPRPVSVPSSPSSVERLQGQERCFPDDPCGHSPSSSLRPASCTESDLPGPLAVS